MCYKETRVHAICNHVAVDHVKCSGKCLRFDTIEILMSTHCQSCRKQVDGAAVLTPAPGPPRLNAPHHINTTPPPLACSFLDTSPPPCSPPRTSPVRATKSPGSTSVDFLKDLLPPTPPPNRELPPTPKKRIINNNAAGRALSPAVAWPQEPDSALPPCYPNTSKPLEIRRTSSTGQPRREPSQACESAAAGGQHRLSRSYTVPKRTSSWHFVIAQPVHQHRPSPPTPSEGHVRPRAAAEADPVRPPVRSASGAPRPKPAPLGAGVAGPGSMVPPSPPPTPRAMRQSKSSLMPSLPSTTDRSGTTKHPGAGRRPSAASSSPGCGQSFFPAPRKTLADSRHRDAEWPAKHGYDWDPRLVRAAHFTVPSLH